MYGHFTLAANFQQGSKILLHLFNIILRNNVGNSILKIQPCTIVLPHNLGLVSRGKDSRKLFKELECQKCDFLQFGDGIHLQFW